MRNIAKLALRLMIFSLAAGVLLAGVNALTEKPIAENLARKQNAGRAAVIGEYDFAPMEFDAQAYPNIAALYEARDGETVVGYVYELSTTGYAGEVLLSLGVSTAGRITGIAVTAHTETKGLGSADEAPFLAQFTGTAAVPETAAGADAMTGATVSSNAVKTAVSCFRDGRRRYGAPCGGWNGCIRRGGCRAPRRGILRALFEGGRIA